MPPDRLRDAEEGGARRLRRRSPSGSCGGGRRGGRHRASATLLQAEPLDGRRGAELRAHVDGDDQQHREERRPATRPASQPRLLTKWMTSAGPPYSQPKRKAPRMAASRVDGQPGALAPTGRRRRSVGVAAMAATPARLDGHRRDHLDELDVPRDHRGRPWMSMPTRITMVTRAWRPGRRPGEHHGRRAGELGLGHQARQVEACLGRRPRRASTPCAPPRRRPCRGRGRAAAAPSAPGRRRPRRLVARRSISVNVSVCVRCEPLASSWLSLLPARSRADLLLGQRHGDVAQRLPDLLDHLPGRPRRRPSAPRRRDRRATARASVTTAVPARCSTALTSARIPSAIGDGVCRVGGRRWPR